MLVADVCAVLCCSAIWHRRCSDRWWRVQHLRSCVSQEKGQCSIEAGCHLLRSDLGCVTNAVIHCNQPMARVLRARSCAAAAGLTCQRQICHLVRHGLTRGLIRCARWDWYLVLPGRDPSDCHALMRRPVHWRQLRAAGNAVRRDAPPLCSY